LLREIGAIDNSSYRQLNGVDLMRASQELRNLREKDIVLQKGKSRATYYIANKDLDQWRGFTDQTDDSWWGYGGYVDDNIYDDSDLSAPVPDDFLDESDLSAPVPLDFIDENDLSAPVPADFLDDSDLSAPVPPDFMDENDLSAPVNESLVHQLPETLQQEIKKLPLRVLNPVIIEEVIYKICEVRSYKITEIAGILGKTDKYILRAFITPMKEKGIIEYSFPDMPNHPEQSYVSIKR